MLFDLSVTKIYNYSLFQRLENQINVRDICSLKDEPKLGFQDTCFLEFESEMTQKYVTHQAKRDLIGTPG